eukprot:8657857-Heterocapsa_arctica.AAC.1
MLCAYKVAYAAHAAYDCPKKYSASTVQKLSTQYMRKGEVRSVTRSSAPSSRAAAGRSRGRTPSFER